MMHLFPEKAGARHRAHTHFFRHPFTKPHIIPHTEFRDVHQHIIGSLRLCKGKPQVFQSADKQILHVGIMPAKLIIILIRKSKPHNGRFHQRCCRSHRKKIMYLFDPSGNMRRRDHIAQTPTCNRIRFGKGTANDCPFAHSRKRGEIGMLTGFIYNMLINLIRNDIDVIFHRQIRDNPKLSIGKYLSAGIGRITQYQRLRPLPEGLFQFSHMEGKGRRLQRYIYRFRARQYRIRPVILIERGKNNYLIPRIRHRQHSRHHGLRTAAGYDNLLLRIHSHPGKMLLLCRQGLPEILCAPGQCILMRAFLRRLRQSVRNSLRRIEIRETLGQINRPVPVGYSRHPADHRIRKSGCPAAQFFHCHSCPCASAHL